MKTVVSLAFAGLLLSSTAAVAADTPSRTSTTASAKVGVQTTTAVTAPNKNIGNKATSTKPIKDHTIGMETIGEAKDKPEPPNSEKPPPPPPPPTKQMNTKTQGY